MNQLSDFFSVRYGAKGYTDKSALDSGNTLLIASQGVENGAYGFRDIPKKHFPPIITVPRTGSIGFAFVQLTPCTVTDDCMVLSPKTKMTTEYLFYIASMIRFSKWRFNYGRKITPARLGRLQVLAPEDFKTDFRYNEMFAAQYPKPNETTRLKRESTLYKEFRIVEIFDLERGSFHAIDRLEEGVYPTISRVSTNNGLVGFYKRPKGAKIFPAGTITVSTVMGDAFLQSVPFIATDNVVMCCPKRKYKLSTLIYIQILLNKNKWRYSYGRQCYKENLQKVMLLLPVTSDNQVDESYIENIVTNQPYWSDFSNRLYSGAK